MDRKFLLVNKLAFMIYLTSAIFHSCTQIKVTEEELFGIWHASDNAKLSLNADKTFSLEGFDSSYWGFSSYEYENMSSKIDGIGNWKIENENRKLILHLSFTELMGKVPFQTYNDETKEFTGVVISSVLEIRGGGIFMNKPPWFLCKPGIDDELDYEFHKKEK